MGKSFLRVMWLGVVSERETGRREVTDIIRGQIM